MRPVILTSALLLAGCVGVRSDLPQDGQDPWIAPLDVADVLGGGSSAGYARALEPVIFDFPRDHGPHPDFRNEWWYFTGNLHDDEGGRYGYQLTVFRSALAPVGTERASAWATRQVYMAHLAVGDERSGTFQARDRFARGAAGLAGAAGDPLRVWLEDWEIAGLAPAGPGERGVLPGGSVQLPPVRLRAGEGEIAIDLILEADRPMVLNGAAGLSQKGPSPGNASYYYSAPRLGTRGTVTSGGRRVEVVGTSWLDREWSTSALEGAQVGWDWFALHLSDGRDLMIYLLRQRDGTVSPQSAGTLIGADGTAEHLDLDGIEIDVLDRWRSPAGVTYPSRWALRIPSAAIVLEIVPMLADQELDVAFRYWEGAVFGDGESEGEPVEVEGFVELTGY